MSAAPYRPLFEFKADRTIYRPIGADGVRVESRGGRRHLRIGARALFHLAREAFADLSFFLRPSFLSNLHAILDDPEASANDRFVAEALLGNAAISAEGELPLCQDTGTINIIAYKGNRVLTDGRDEEALALGAGPFIASGTCAIRRWPRCLSSRKPIPERTSRPRSISPRPRGANTVSSS